MANPVAIPEFSMVTDEDQVLSGIDVLTGVSDPDNNPIPISVNTATATNGTVTIEADGTLTYTPNADFNGTDTITYEIIDGDGEVSTSTVLIEVSAVNDDPNADAFASITRSSDESLSSIDVLTLLNASDVEGENLTVTEVSSVNGYGSVSLNPDNTINYDAELGVNQGDLISVTIEDESGGLTTRFIEVNVDLPADENTVIATDDQVSVQAGFNGLLTGVGAPADSPFSAANALSNDIGFDKTDEVVYDENGQRIDDYTAFLSHVNGEAITQTVELNDIGEYTVTNDLTIAGDNGGTFTVSAEGFVSFDSGSEFDDLPAGESATTGFVYTLTDDNGQVSSARYDVTVNSSQGPLEAVDDNFTVTENNGENYSYAYLSNYGGVSIYGSINGSTSFNVLQNDITSLKQVEVAGIVDGFSITSTKYGPGYAIQGSEGGRFEIYEDGTAIFRPYAEFAHLSEGESITTSASYIIEDINGEQSTATVNVTVEGREETPKAIGEFIDVAEGFVGYGAVFQSERDTDTSIFKNDTLFIEGEYKDLDLDTVSIASVNGQALVGGEVTVAGSDGGVFTVFSDGSVRVDASGLSASTTEEPLRTSFEYTLADANGNESEAASFTAEVQAQDPDFQVVVSENAHMFFNVNQIPGAEGLTQITAVDGGAPLAPNSTVLGSNGGEFIVYEDGSVYFNTSRDFEYLSDGDSEFTTLTVSGLNGEGETVTEDVAVLVNGVNDAPRINGDYFSVGAGSNGSLGNVLLNDSDVEGHSISVASVTGDSQADYLGNFEAQGSNGGTFTVNKNGQLSFDAGSDFDHLVVGESQVTRLEYSAEDELGARSYPLSLDDVEVTVHGTNHRPDGVDDSFSINAGETKMLAELVQWGYWRIDKTLLANDTDADNDSLNILSVTNGSQIVELVPGQPMMIMGTNGGEFYITPDGQMAFSANGFEELSATETAQTTIKYVVADENGAKSTAEVVVTIQGQDGDAVAAEDDVYTTNEDTALLGVNVIQDNDISVNGGLEVTAVNGSQSNVGFEVIGDQGGKFTVGSDGGLSFDPDGDFEFLVEGTKLTTSVTYTVTDSNGEFATATASVEVTGVNDAPEVQDDLGYVVDAGSVSNLAYLQDYGIWGVIDNTLLANDSDVENETIYISQVNGELLTGSSITVAGDNGGTFTVGQDGSMTFDASSGFEYLIAGQTITTAFEYTLSDIRGAESESTARVEVTVNGAEDSIIAASDYYLTASEDDPLMTGSNVLLINDWSYNDVMSVYEVNFDTTKVGQEVAGSEGGLFTISADGALVFDANGDFDYLSDAETVTTTVSYTIISDVGETSSATVNVQVTGANDAAVAGDDFYTVDAGSMNNQLAYLTDTGTWGILDSTLLANDEDAENDTLEIVSVDNGSGAQVLSSSPLTFTGSNGGSFTVDSSGVMSFDAEGYEYLSAGEQAQTGFSYSVIDAGGDISTANVSVTVVGKNDAVTAFNDFYNANEDGAVSGFNVIQDNDTSVYAPESLTVTSVDGSSAGVGNAMAGENGGLFTIAADGSLTFDAAGDFEHLDDGESQSTSISYQVSAANGNFSTAVVTVNVSGSNDAVVAVDDNYNMDAGTVVELSQILDAGRWGLIDATILRNDQDSDGDALFVSAVNGQAISGGQVTVTGSNGGSFTVSDNGVMSFDASSGFDDLALDEVRTSTMTYTVSDGDTFDTATVSVDVYGVEDPIV